MGKSGSGKDWGKGDGKGKGWGKNGVKDGDVHVIMAVYEKKGEASEAWDEQDMIPEDQTRYRA